MITETTPWKPYWTTTVCEFKALKVPTQEEILKHFFLSSIEEKIKNPLKFESEEGDEQNVIIFFMTNGGDGLRLSGWTTDIVRGSIDVGSFIKKCEIVFNGDNTKARVLFEKERNQEVWELRIKER